MVKDSLDEIEADLKRLSEEGQSLTAAKEVEVYGLSGEALPWRTPAQYFLAKGLTPPWVRDSGPVPEPEEDPLPEEDPIETPETPETPVETPEENPEEPSVEEPGADTPAPDEPQDPTDPTDPTEPTDPIEPAPGIDIEDPDVPLGEEPDDEVEIEDPEVPLAGPFTRADAIGYLWEQTGSPDAELSDFPDVPEDHYWAVAIGWAQDMGIALPDEEGNFRPDDPVLRSSSEPEGELQQFLNRYAVFAGAAEQGETFIQLTGAWDDIIMGEEAQVIFDEFFAKLEAALTRKAA